MGGPDVMAAEGASGYDDVVLGAGTAGCLLAARLSEDPDRSVCLVEAGPDYGPFSDGRWPLDMLDARALPASHGWGYEDPSASRARIIGGCSAHNACFVVWGHPRDYDAWSEPTGGAWSFEVLEPYLRRAAADLHTRVHGPDELGPWDRALIDGAAELGYPSLDDPNDLGRPEGAAPYAVNAEGSVRWNTAFAYLDAARGRPNLTILDRTLVDRLDLAGDRVRGVRVVRDGHPTALGANRVILAAGAYGSPAVLLRSGIGPEEHLADVGVPVSVPRPGVGAGLRDHCGSWLEIGATERLQTETASQAERGLWQAAAILKARSGVADEGYWDVQVYTWTDAAGEDAAGPSFRFYLVVKIQNARSEGIVRLASADPAVLPVVDPAFLSDPGDAARLVSGIRIARRLFATSAMGELVAGEIDPGPSIASDEDLAAYARTHLAGHFHPVGTCRMGSEDDPLAVTDGAGRVHGVEGLFVADASVFPDLPRANTNLTVAAVAERIAESLRGGA